jgi:ribosomal protein S18 acetylase RimI-like enzyme
VSRAPDAHPLENPVRSSLLGPHARFAERRGNVLRYPVDVSPFVALPAEPDDADWADAAALAGPGGIVPLAGVTIPPPAGWEVVMSGAGVQLVDDGIAAAPDDEAVRLGAPDVPQMLDLSAVCTDEAYRGQGLATRLVLAVAAGIRARGETPFLHAAATNANAILLYESLGFRLRRHTTFSAARVPVTEPVT